MNKFKALGRKIVDNRSVIIKRAVILASAGVGLVLVGALVSPEEQETTDDE